MSFAGFWLSRLHSSSDVWPPSLWDFSEALGCRCGREFQGVFISRLASEEGWKIFVETRFVVTPEIFSSDLMSLG